MEQAINLWRGLGFGIGKRVWGGVCFLAFSLLAWCGLLPGGEPAKEPGGDPPLAYARPPKPLSEKVKAGLNWLIKQQNEDGSWGQGEESEQMGKGMAGLVKAPNVADTSMAVLALLRAGANPKEGEYSKPLLKAIEFICREIAGSDEKSLFITGVRNTRTQQKLGQFIDTFLSAQVLAEVWKEMPEADLAKRTKEAFHKVMDKIEKNQRPDGTWDQQGWATAISQGMGARSIGKARSRGYAGGEAAQRRAEGFAQGKSEDLKPAASSTPSKPVFEAKAVADSAGVELYARASAVGSLQSSQESNDLEKEGLHEEINAAEGRLSELAKGAEPKRPEEAKEIQGKLQKNKDKMDAIVKNEKALAEAQTVLVNRLDDKTFLAGFGSNGGEEFLSYMQIGESLVLKGGEEWEKWDREMSGNLNRIQNADGSWTGHHCITGRTFCTSAALMALMADRTKTPVASKIKKP